jgi:hypothetical protein
MPLVPLWGSGWSFWIRDYLKLCQSTIDGGQNGLFIEYEQRGFDCRDTGIRDAPRRTRAFARCDLDRKSLFTRFTCVKRSGFFALTFRVGFMNFFLGERSGIR